jgi:hypothetical protein
VGGVGALVREGTRRQAAALVAVVLVVALGLGAGLTSLEAAHRTERAYPDYLERAEVGDLVVNPGFPTRRIERILRETPGVVDLASDGLLSAGPSETALFSQVRVSEDGRYVRQDRPVVRDGRMIGHGQEAFLSTEAADEFDVEVGDTLTLGVQSADFIGGPPPSSLGSVDVEVVGIGTFPDEVLPDELFPRQRILVTPEVGARYDCRIRHPEPDDPRPLDELVAALIPPDCSGGNRFYSMHVEAGADGARAVADALADRLREENERLPRAIREVDGGFSVFASFTSEEADRVRESLSPAVTALRTFGIITGLASVVVALLLAVRLARRRLADLVVWRALGATRRARAAAVAGPLALAFAVGVLGAAGVAWLASPVGPVASARTVVPDPAPGLAADLWVPVGVAVLLLLVGAALSAWSVAGAASHPRPVRTRGWARLPTAPEATLGVRAAVGSAGAGTALAGVAVALAAVTATLVYGADLAEFVGTPARFGWPYDAAALTNAGYGEADLAAVADSLDGNPDVEAWGVASVTPGFAVDGESLPVIASRPSFDALAATPVVDGRLPAADDEVALGSDTAEDLDVGLGDDVTVTHSFGERRARVVGTVVLPALGPLEAARTSMGTGLLVPAPFFDAVLTDAEEQVGVAPADFADSQSGLVTVDLAAGVDAGTFFADLGDGLAAWDSTGFTVVTLDDPVRPATVIDVAAMRRVPLLLAAAFGVAMVASLVAGIATGTWARRRELAVVAALGGTRRQVQGSVRWHAAVMVLIGLGVGIPVGVVAGRVAFTAFVRDLGAVPDAATPLLLLLVLAAVVAAVGALAAVVVGRRAAHHRGGVARLLTQDTAVRA